MNGTMPLISVITPSYNHAAYLEETIQSVLQQNYPHLEHIVMDGASTDATLEVLQAYDAHLRWRSEPDRGQADAVNKGLRLAQGDILGWLNADDTYLPGAIHEVATYFQRHPEIDVVYGEAYHIDECGNRIERYYTEPFEAQRLCDICFICQPTVFFRQRVVQEIGLLDTSLHYCMDYDYWIRISKRYRMAYLNTYLANSRLHRESKTLAQQVAAHAEILRMLRRHYGRVSPRWLYADACVTLTAKLMPYVQGLYHDGWASQRLRIFPPKVGYDCPYLDLHAVAPEQSLPLTVHVTAGERIVYETVVDTPQFRLRVPWQRAGVTDDRQTTTELQIITNKTICPQALGLHADQRHLAFRLKTLALHSRNRQKCVLYADWQTYLLCCTLPVLFLWRCLCINHALPYHDVGKKSRQLWNYLRTRTL